MKQNSDKNKLDVSLPSARLTLLCTVKVNGTPVVLCHASSAAAPDLQIKLAFFVHHRPSIQAQIIRLRKNRIKLQIPLSSSGDGCKSCSSCRFQSFLFALSKSCYSTANLRFCVRLKLRTMGAAS